MKYKPRRARRMAEGSRCITPEEVAISEARARASVGRREVKSYEDYLRDKKVD